MSFHSTGVPDGSFSSAGNDDEKQEMKDRLTGRLPTGKTDGMIAAGLDSTNSMIERVATLRVESMKGNKTACHLVARTGALRSVDSNIKRSIEKCHLSLHVGLYCRILNVDRAVSRHLSPGDRLRP